MNPKHYTCPCCGYLTIQGQPGSYSVCSVCNWEDDPIQMLNPWFAEGANKPSLVDAQKNFKRYGHCNGEEPSEQAKQPDVVRDPAWRPARESDRKSIKRPRDISNDEWQDAAAWYYWCRNA